MEKNSSVVNYLGQLRIYSLIDLVILGFAAQASTLEMAGILLIWISFLALLEGRHRHAYRAPVPEWLWIPFFAIGTGLYGHFGYALCAVGCMKMYTLKDSRSWGLASPFFRGGFNFALIAGVTGPWHYLPWLAFLLICTRNILGDCRDVEKDRAAQMQTIPVLLGLQRNWITAHLDATLFTTLIWWLASDLPGEVFPLVAIIQFFAYSMTPR